MAEKITYKDHFDADFEAGIDRLKVKVADLYEEFKKLALEQSKTNLVTKDTAETNKKLAEAQAKLVQMETQLATIRKKNLDAQAKLTVEYQKEVAQRNEAIKSARLLAQVVNAENNSAEKLRATIAFLNSEKAKLNLSTADGIKKHEVWTKTVNNLDAKLTGLGTTLQKQGRNVGNYQYNMNGLNFSFAQLTREAPAFANSINTGFMALSNNIPMFVDQINQVRAANKAMNAEGIKTPSVFKSIMGAMFSWQTALSLTVTLLTLYGKEIVNWISNLFDANKELEKQNELQKQLNDTTKEGVKDAQDNLASLDVLYKASQDQTRTLEERKKAVDELQKQYPKYFANLSDEAILSGKATKAYDLQRQAIIDVALAQAYKNKISENAKKIVDIEDNIEKEQKKLKIQEERSERLKEAAEKQKDVNEQIKIYTALAQNRGLEASTQNDIDDLEKEKKLLEELNNKYTSKIKIESILSNTGKTSNGKNEKVENIKQENIVLKENLELQTKLRGGVEGTQTISTPIPDMSQYSDTRQATFGEWASYWLMSEDFRSALKTSYSETYQIVQDEQNRMYELAKKKSDLAKSEVDAARDNLQKQKDLRDEGRAYNIIAAQQELDDAIKFQKKKEAEEFKALKRKQALESVSQATNLISASASIIKDTAGQPYLYVPLIAAMWIAFAGAKARAYKETKQEFSNGGTGMIGGGSHASGNDTYFGTSNGKRMYAQNGERWAIFNNIASRNPELERWINDINKGSLSLRNYGQTQVNIFDTRQMERGIEKVARNTSEKVYYENGKRIVKQGNTTTYYV